MLCVGIDLGTSNSVISVKRNGHFEALPIAPWNINNPNIVPSIVEKNGDILCVHQSDNGNQIIKSIKRLMGSTQTVLGHTPSEISAVILQYMISRAEEILEEKIDEAVITVPAYFDNIQRLATRLSASIANIKVLRLINEPTAAALAYGLEHKQNEKIAIYDLGGGTFDFSVLNIYNGVFQVLATGGDTRLGGDDIDEDIAIFCCQRYGIKYQDLSDGDKAQCITAARQLKEKTVASIYLNLGKYTAAFYIDANELQDIINQRLEKTIQISNTAIKDANLELSNISSIILIGGMTKSLEVKNFIRSNFSCQILDSINPDETVSIGAAAYANAITSKSSLLIDVTPLTLGVETFGGGVDAIIARNSPIPYEATAQYTTIKDAQTKISINVLQGESNLAAECRSLAKFELKDIPPNPAGKVVINVNFKIDVNGILFVSAWESNSEKIKRITIEPTEGLTEELLIQMLKNCNN